VVSLTVSEVLAAVLVVTSIEGVNMIVWALWVTTRIDVATFVIGVNGCSGVICGKGSGAFPFADSVIVMNDVCVTGTDTMDVSGGGGGGGGGGGVEDT
jgi:hypothetical protein